jgi:integrase
MTNKEDVPVVMPMNITVGAFLDRHLEVAKESLMKRTWENHDDTVHVHLTPMLGHLKLKELRREHIQHLYTIKRGKGLSAGTVRRIHAVLSSACRRAVRWRLVTHNICQDVDPPRPENSEIRPLNQQEARKFLLGAKSERYHALYRLALTSGMRRDEILGLRWGSLDFTPRTLQVRHALVAGRGFPL